MDRDTKQQGPRTPSPQAQLWPEGLTPFPFQLDALHLILARLTKHRAAYLHADPGTGKTIIASLVCASQRGKKALYVCPPSLCSNVEAEFKKWGHKKNMPVIIPDSNLANATPLSADIALVDEAHRFKNANAQRSRGLIRLLSRTPKVVLLSGTPMPNSRPAELWFVLRHFAPDLFGTAFWPFVRKFCGAHQTPFGWRFDDFTSRAEFESTLFQSFMTRIKKSTLNLPPKREGLLTVGDGMSPIISQLERQVLRAYSEDDLLRGRIAAREGKASLHLAEYLRLLGLEKLQHVTPIIDHILYDTDEALLVYAHHRAVIAALARHLANFRPVVITGATPTPERHALVDRFQRGETRVAVLNIQAAGLGWNMTRADRVLFVERSWRPGDNDQAGDRAHRIGRKRSVLVQYVVLKDSFDARQMSAVLAKRQRAI